MCGTCGCDQTARTAQTINDISRLSPPRTEQRRLQVEINLMAQNDHWAALNRERLDKAQCLALNLMSSPGSGKTTLLEKTLQALPGSLSVAVIEGDQQTEQDAERIRAAGAPAVQINTGKGCHLEAQRVSQALDQLLPGTPRLLFIENVGNLVCPAGFDLGEQRRVVLLSVTEGDDKPLKYPDIFARADLLLFTKTDLLPYVDFNRDRCLEFARRIRPDLPALSVSATHGDGLTEWLEWLGQPG